MHLEARKAKGNIDYYLTQSFRLNGKPRKSRVYLGRNLSEKEIEVFKKYNIEYGYGILQQ